MRSMAELAAVAELSPFNAAEMDAPANIQYVAFMAAKCSAEAQRKMKALCNPVDDFQIRGRELYWLRRRALGESVFVGKLLEKTLAQRRRRLRARSGFHGNGVTRMLDLFYVLVGCLFLLLCWAFTKACDKL